MVHCLPPDVNGVIWVAAARIGPSVAAPASTTTPDPGAVAAERIGLAERRQRRCQRPADRRSGQGLAPLARATRA